MPLETIKGKDFIQVRAWAGFGGGLNTDLPPTKIPDNCVFDSLNVNFDRDCASKRYGFKYLSTVPDGLPIRYIDSWNDSTQERTQWIFVMTNAHIYSYDVSSNTFTDISPPGGLNGIVSEDYTGIAFTGVVGGFKTGCYFLTNAVDGPCYFDGVAGHAFAWLTTPGAPLQARDVIAFANHLLWFNVLDPTQGYQPQEVIWSDNLNGLEYASGDAGAALLEDTNDDIVAAELVTDYLAIARSYSIYLASFIGYPFFYQFTRRIEKYGVVSTESWEKTEINIMGLSHNNIIAFDGANLNAFIGQNVIRDIKKTVPSNDDIGGSFSIYHLDDNKWRLLISSRQDGYTDTEYSYSTLYQNWSKHFLSLHTPITAAGFADYGFFPRWMDMTDIWQNANARWSDAVGALISPAMFCGGMSGELFLALTGFDDAGTVINSYFKTKQSDMNMAGWIKELNRLQFVLDNHSMGTLTVHVFQSDDGYNYTEADNSPVNILMTGNPTPFADVFAVGSHFYLQIVNNNLDEYFSIQEIIATVIPLFEVDHA